MSLFKASSETAKDPVSKILLWGPPGAGKTHFALSAPKPALIDVETRGRSFAVRQTEFNFVHAEAPMLADFAEAVREVRSGKIDCESVVVDSGSAIYLKLVEEHTKPTGDGAYVTDWVTVNRRFLSCLNFVFSIAGRNVLFTMHAATKLVREGRSFRAAGLHFIGDERFRFGFDYIFRLDPQGKDPAKTLFHVEKTSSPALTVGDAVPGLTWNQFRDVTGPKKPVPPQRSSMAAAAPASPDTLRVIDRLAVELGYGDLEIGALVRGITSHRTASVRDLSKDEQLRLQRMLQDRMKGAA
jgi:AAA domain